MLDAYLDMVLRFPPETVYLLNYFNFLDMWIVFFMAWYATPLDSSPFKLHSSRRTDAKSEQNEHIDVSENTPTAHTRTHHHRVGHVFHNRNHPATLPNKHTSN